MDPERQRYPRMREIVFRVLAEGPGHLEAQSDAPAIRIAAPTLEDLQHEAREALIERVGPTHCTYRVRIRRGAPALAASVGMRGSQPWGAG